MDILTGLRIVRANLDRLTVTGLENADRLAGCGHMIDNIISAAESVKDEKPTENPVKEEDNG